MMKRIFTTFVLLLLFLMTAKAAETEKMIHISQQVTDKVRVEADVVIPDGQEEYGAYEVTDIPHDVSENAISARNTLLFLDQNAEYTGGLRQTEGWADDYYWENEGREAICLDRGSGMYTNWVLEERYDGILLMYGQIRQRYGALSAEGISTEDMQGDVRCMDREEADRRGTEVLKALCPGLEPSLIYMDALNGAQMQMLRDAYAQTEEAKYYRETYGHDWIGLRYDWLSDDGLYAVHYGLKYDGILIFGGGEEDGLYTPDFYESIRFLSAAVNARVYVNEDGVFSAYVSGMGIGELLYSGTLVPVETVIENFRKKMDDIIVMREMVVSDIALRYMVVPDLDGEKKLIPAWCFYVDYVIDGIRYPSKVFAFDALTGEAIE